MNKVEELPKWLEDAIARINAETQRIVLDTQEKLDKYQDEKEYGRKLRLGDTIIVMSPPKFVADAQQGLDDWKAREFLRNNPEYRK